MAKPVWPPKEVMLMSEPRSEAGARVEKSDWKGGMRKDAAPIAQKKTG